MWAYMTPDSHEVAVMFSQHDDVITSNIGAQLHWEQCKDALTHGPIYSMLCLSTIIPLSIPPQTHTHTPLNAITPGHCNYLL